MKVKLIPKTQRAKNRVKEYGDTFYLLDNKGYKILVEEIYLGNGFSSVKKEVWMGWFNKHEAEWQEITKEN